MNKLWFYLSTAALAVAVVCWADSVRAVDFTFGDFEDFQFVSQDFGGGDYNVTTTQGQIHNGPTPDNGTGPDSPDDGDTDPQPTPVSYPGKPGGGTNTYGNWDRGGLGGSINNDRNTGFGDWGYNSTGIFSASTTKGVTSGSKSIRLNPNLFGGTAGGNYTQHLASSLTLLPEPLGANTFTAYLANKYLAVDITMDSSEWTGTGNFVQFGVAHNVGSTSSTAPLVDRFGYWDIGIYHENTANPAVAMARTPNFDTGNPANPGLWDPTNYAGITTRTLYWDYSNWEAPPNAFGGQVGDPPSGVWYDARTFATNFGSDSNNGWNEFNFWQSYSSAFTAGAIYFDNWRFTSTPPVLSDADFDDDNDVDAADIDILWHIIRQTGTDPNNNDTADLDGSGLANEDDVDFMLAGLLDAGGNRAYGDANLSGGTPELTDYNLWRTGTGGWANGDFDGSGGVPELNDYNLWRTGPTQFPGTVGSHGGGGGAPLVPEPSSFLLAAIACGCLVVLRRKGMRIVRSA